MTFTHADLVALARRWLLGYGKCDFVFSEYGAPGHPEWPDALGFLRPGATILIEVKVSRADFLSDARKPFRQKPETGVGDWRYYLVPQGLLTLSDLPERWGLLEVTPAGKIKRTHELAITQRESKRQLAATDDMSQWPASVADIAARWREWRTRVDAERFPVNREAELAFLYSACHRLELKGAFGILKTSPLAEVHWHVGPCEVQP